MIIIDFYGVPGCGKSTISHILTRLLENDGKTVAEPIYYLDHYRNIFLRKIKKVFISSLWIVLHPFKLVYIIKILNKYNLKYNYLFKEIISVSTKSYYCYKYRRKKINYLIFDEAFTQSLISLENMDERFLNSDLKKIEKVAFDDSNIIRVYVHEDINIALKRIENRDSNDSRVEKEKSQIKRYNMMRKYETLCNKVRYGRRIVVTEKNQSAESKALRIYNRITNGVNHI